MICPLFKLWAPLVSLSSLSPVSSHCKMYLFHVKHSAISPGYG